MITRTTNVGLPTKLSHSLVGLPETGDGDCSSKYQNARNSTPSLERLESTDVAQLNLTYEVFLTPVP